jgi:hypothetical protein
MTPSSQHADICGALRGNEGLCRGLFGLESFNLRDFWATEAPLTATMLAYDLMSLFRPSVLRVAVPPTMATLRHHVFANPGWRGVPGDPHANAYTLTLSPQRRAWLAERWSAAINPSRLPESMINPSQWRVSVDW